MIPIILITGFLGSGKTTLLKRMAEQNRDRRWVYLVNDFGSVDVDGELVERVGERVVALSGGSIFCTCLVTDFIRTLKMIAEDRTFLAEPPEAVVIEASGMADPSVIRHMLKETRLDQIYTIRRMVAVADPGTFYKLLKTLPNIRAQIETADTVLISKADVYDAKQIAEVEDAVRAIQPDAECHAVIMNEVDMDLLAARAIPVVKGDYAPRVDPNFHRFTIKEALPNLTRLKTLVHETAEDLYRAKGFIQEDGQVYAVDYSSSGLNVEKWTDAATTLRLVCIVRGEAGAAVERIWRDGGA